MFPGKAEKDLINECAIPFQLTLQQKPCIDNNNHVATKIEGMFRMYDVSIRG
jgi:hypothetical protein